MRAHLWYWPTPHTNNSSPPHTTITSTPTAWCAQFFREKLRADVEGRSYTPPPPSAVPPTGVSRSGGSSANQSRAASAKNLDEWGDWGDSKVREDPLCQLWHENCKVASQIETLFPNLAEPSILLLKIYRT